jgi:hypothetical protein
MGFVSYALARLLCTIIPFIQEYEVVARIRGKKRNKEKRRRFR